MRTAAHGMGFEPQKIYKNLSSQCLTHAQQSCPTVDVVAWEPPESLLVVS